MTVAFARLFFASRKRHTIFARDWSPDVCSADLSLAPGTRLEADQVSAIVNLVANSVPRLDAKDVSVVDQHGALLSRGLDDWAGGGRGWSLQNDYQSQVAGNIEAVLAPVLGAGNYRVSVAADIDFSQREETIQSF